MAKNFFGHEIARTDAKALPDLLKARFPMGNFLVLTDEESAAVFEPLLKRLHKKLFAVWREGDDLLPLFSEPDKITCAVGVGGGIPAARYFAAVRSLPCAAVCPSFAPCGAGGGEICVTVAGEKTRFPVPLPNLIAFCEPADGRGLEEGRAFLSLCAVQTFAFSACRRLGVGEEEKGGEGEKGKSGEKGEELFPLFRAAADCRGTEGETLFSALLTAEYCLSRGSGGEAFALARLVKKYARLSRADTFLSCARAFAGLCALFFGSGFLRFGKADYNARRKEAERLFPEEGIPAPEVPTQVRLLSLAAAFEENRAALFAEISALVKTLPPCPEEKIRKAGGILRFLPELYGGGISALMRDFGLL